MTRLRVEPVRERHGDLVGCTGFTMPDGTVYRSNRAGYIDVDNPHHVKEALANPGADGAVIVSTGGVPRSPGASCRSCGFSGYPFHCSAPCPRCGGVVERDETP